MRATPFGPRRKKVEVFCDWCGESFMTSQPGIAKYCPGTNHRVYAWRARQREAATMVLE